MILKSVFIVLFLLCLQVLSEQTFCSTEYKVVEQSDVNVLSSVISELLNNDWHLSGNIVITMREGKTVYSQVLLKC
jgi:hypothetical protein